MGVRGSGRKQSIKIGHSNGNKKTVLMNGLMFLGSLLMCIAISLISITPQTFDIVEGEISPQTIPAPRTVVDSISTQRLIEEEQAKIGPSYKIDTEKSQQIFKKVNDNFAAFLEVQKKAEAIYKANQEGQIKAAQEALTPPATEPVPPMPTPTSYTIKPYNPEQTDWAELLSDEQIKEMMELLPEFVASEDLLTILSTTQTYMEDLQSAVEKQVQKQVYDGIASEEEDEVKTAIVSGVAQNLELTAERKNLLNKLISNDISYNEVFDEAATQARKDEIAKMITPVEYKQGKNIVVKGEPVSPEAYAILKDLGMLSSETTSIKPYLAAVSYIVLLFFMYAMFLYFFNKKLLMNVKKVAVISILTAAAYGFTAIAQLVALHIYPIFLFVILAGVLISPKNAMVYGVFLSTLLMSITTGGQELFSVDSLIMLLTMLTGSFFAMFVIKDMRYRFRLIAAGLVAVVPGLVIELMAWMFGIINENQLIRIYGIMALSGLMCGVASIGVLPILENAFRLITPSKLLELSGPDHPLLKRLMFEAPGTYHHSMLVANLAEAACDTIGGFSLLARVGAYFHDVGKLENPLYFRENQKGNFNPHDDLPPEKSAKIIKKHVPDGLALLKKYNMPKEIETIVAQHHGNSVVKYFYHKALLENPNVDRKLFQYDGVPPATREGALIMLADIVEAAVRSLDNPGREELEEQVGKLIKACYDEGQLDNAPLNRQDLNKVKEAFVNIFGGVYHKRIKYPNINFHGVEDGDNVL